MVISIEISQINFYYFWYVAIKIFRGNSSQHRDCLRNPSLALNCTAEALAQDLLHPSEAGVGALRREFVGRPLRSHALSCAHFNILF